MARDDSQHPTWGDLAREHLRRHGLLFCGDVQEEVRSRLQRLPAEVRQAFAVACATRLIAEHERQPPFAHRAFTLGWRPVLDAIWSGLAGPREPALQLVCETLRAFYSSRSFQTDGPDGPDDADEDAAAASIYAAQCFEAGAVASAVWAASRAVDAACQIAEDDLGHTPGAGDPPRAVGSMEFVQELMHPVVQAELRKQLADLDSLEQTGVTANSLQRLRQQARSGLGPSSRPIGGDVRESTS
jgi:hypothetical protein